jgi:hypothetical protein
MYFYVILVCNFVEWRKPFDDLEGLPQPPLRNRSLRDWIRHG